MTTPHTEEELRQQFYEWFSATLPKSQYEIADFFLPRLKEDRRAVVEGLIAEVGEDDVPFANTEYSMGVEGGRKSERQRIRQLLTSALTALDCPHDQIESNMMPATCRLCGTVLDNEK